MRRPSVLLGLAAAVAWGMTGCAPAAKPVGPKKPAAGSHDHDGHDHAGHDHAGHDHAGHDHAGHDHAGHDHPETLAEGLAELERAARDVAEKLAAEGDEAADAAIHAAGHVVDDLRQLLDKQPGLAAAARAAAAKSLDELFEAFNAVDEAMHAGGEDAKAKAAEAHEAVKQTIERAVQSLKDRFAKADGGTD